MHIKTKAIKKEKTHIKKPKVTKQEKSESDDNKVHVYITAFGKFYKIVENPTTFLARKLEQKHKNGEIYNRIPNMKIE